MCLVVVGHVWIRYLIFTQNQKNEEKQRRRCLTPQMIVEPQRIKQRMVLKSRVILYFFLQLIGSSLLLLFALKCLYVYMFRGSLHIDGFYIQGDFFAPLKCFICSDLSMCLCLVFSRSVIDVWIHHLIFTQLQKMKRNREEHEHEAENVGSCSEMIVGPQRSKQ